MAEWIRCTDCLPPEGETVWTCTNDGKGIRNECRLMRMGRLWFAPDGSMYVYYEPSHWRPNG